MSEKANLSVADVTRAPTCRPATTEDGVSTGLWVTLEQSVGLTASGPRQLPIGTLLSAPISGGHDDRLSANCERRKLGLDGDDVTFRM